MSEPIDSGRQPDGRFAPGNNANPAGRPRGSRNKAIQALDALGREAAEELVKSVIDSAKDGDMQAARIILDRIWPSRRGAPVSLDLPSIKTAADVQAAMAAVAEAVAGGQITPDEGEAFCKLVEANRKAIETADLAERIERLEQMNGGRIGQSR